MTDGTLICTLAELPDDAARGITVNHDGETLEGFVVRKNGKVFGYINRCPHTGVNLEWKPDTFLTLDRDLIQCSTHGARFKIENGYCVSGPCIGQSLESLPLAIKNNRIYLSNSK